MAHNRQNFRQQQKTKVCINKPVATCVASFPGSPRACDDKNLFFVPSLAGGAWDEATTCVLQLGLAY